jgi:hypothetical protein
MPNAFNNTTMNNLQGSIRSLFYRRQKVGKLHLTNDEYLHTFVPREARAAVREAAPWMCHDGRRHRFDLYGVKAAMELRVPHEKPDGHPMPVMRLLMIQGDAPKDVVDKIQHWTERGGDYSRDFGRVVKVLEMLNTTQSRVAIRYYWPTILALCSEGHNTKELVTELQEMRQPARLKPLPAGLQAACRLTAETIATARLIPADAEEDEGGEVVIDIITGQQYNEPFSSFYGLG